MGQPGNDWYLVFFFSKDNVGSFNMTQKLPLREQGVLKRENFVDLRIVFEL